ncbi:hypothetical protein Adt_01958 [Abeliophyllum distichum]|uniref:PB1-like domain-containing protein n=1 Tax=Abeliophyllum distichum TaxID=126358 RepID=A0ABD1VXH3_9LAMI
MRIRREAVSIPQYRTFFERMRNVFYSHGEVHFIDEIDADYFLKFEIDCIAESLGLSQPLGYVYRRPKLSLVDGLMRLMSDKDVLDDIDAEKHHFGTLIELIVEEVDDGCDENIVEVERDLVDIVESQPLSGSQPSVISQDDVGGNSDYAEEVRQFDDHSNEEGNVVDQNKEADIVDQNEEHEVPDEEHNEVPDEQHDEEFNDSDYEQEVPILNDDANFETHYTWDDDRPIVHEGIEDDDSDELRNLDSDEEGCGKKKRENVYSGRADNEDPQFQIGLQFETKAQLKNLIKQYSVKHGRAIKFVKDDRIRLQG